MMSRKKIANDVAKTGDKMHSLAADKCIKITVMCIYSCVIQK